MITTKVKFYFQMCGLAAGKYYICSMKVLIDDKIPYIREAAKRLFGRADYAEGGRFRESGLLADADAIIIRTRTRCDEALLRGTQVSFIATATIGYDHLDTDYLERAGISWTNCPGCNAASVGQYIRNALYRVCLTRGLRPQDLCVGIVGWGHVGKQVEKALMEAGFRTLLNDPPLQAAGEGRRRFISLEEMAGVCNVITFHTPLTKSGAHPTFHLADAAFFHSLRNKPVIINAARGGVVDEKALLEASATGRVNEMIIDTWEGEPDINRELLEKAFIATPHVAGYSADGKSNATRMALRAVCAHFGIAITEEREFLRLTAPPPLPADIRPTGDALTDSLALYDPLSDSARLKACLEGFEYQRGHYPLRRENFSN